MRDLFWIDPEYAPELAIAGFAGPADFMSNGLVVRSVGNKQNVVARSQGRDFFIKRYSPDRAGLGLKELDNTRLVAGMGIPVPAPAAAGCFSGGSFFACAGIAGGLPLDDWLAARARSGPILRRSEKNAIIVEVAAIARKLHMAGYCHRDLYLCHFFVVESGDPRLHLIDMQRVRRAFPFRRRWVVKDLAAVNYSAGPGICTNTDRFRFLRSYLGHGKLGGKDRALAGLIARKTSRIARHESRKAGADARGQESA